MMVRVEAEIVLPDGTVLHPGEIVDVAEFPGLENAVCARAVSPAAEPTRRGLRTK